MKHIHNDLDVFLLVAIGWIGLLSLIFQLFATINPQVAPITEFNNIIIYFGGYNIKAFTPPVTLSEYNISLMISSILLFGFGLRVIVKNGLTKLRYWFLGFQAFYFVCQVLGFIVFGLYPLPAALMSLFAGASIYNFGLELLDKKRQ